MLTVSNTGTPIPPGDQAKVFDRFYRADASRSREIEGTGLGLSLAREMARAHGGDLVLVQSDEQRTTFALRLPLLRPSAVEGSLRPPYSASAVPRAGARVDGR